MVEENIEKVLQGKELTYTLPESNISKDKYLILQSAVLEEQRKWLYKEFWQHIWDNEGHLPDKEKMKFILQSISIEECREAVFKKYKIDKLSTFWSIYE